MINTYLKLILSFLLGVLIYHIIKKTCSCKKTVEGLTSLEDIVKSAEDKEKLKQEQEKKLGPGGTEKIPSPSPSSSPPLKLNEIGTNQGFDKLLVTMEMVLK